MIKAHVLAQAKNKGSPMFTADRSTFAQSEMRDRELGAYKCFEKRS